MNTEENQDRAQPEHASDNKVEGRTRAIRTVTLGGLLVNLLLSVIKFILGVVGSSQALIADAVHSVSDAVTDCVILVGASLWSAPPDEAHPHGHGRIETVITLFVGVVLAAVFVVLLVMVIKGRRRGEEEDIGEWEDWGE